MTDEEIKKLKDEVHTWKEASSANSYKAFQLQEENKTLAQHILELQNDKGELVDKCKELEAQIEKMKNCKNCANYMISGKCPSFFRTGWCKNWELAD